MHDTNTLWLAFLTTALGLSLILAALLVVLSMKRRQAAGTPAVEPFLPEPEDGSGEAVIVVAAGGRIRRMNAQARQLFRLADGELPNLERLARQALPSEGLIDLCAAEGQARLVLSGRPYEASSYRIGLDGHAHALVSLRSPQPPSRPASIPPTQILQTVADLSRTITASLDLDETIAAVRESMEKLVPADFLEIALWDADREVLTAYRFEHVTGAGNLPLQAVQPQDACLAGRLLREHRSVLIADLGTSEEVGLTAQDWPAPPRSLMGLPLLLGDIRVGTLIFGSLAPAAFGEEDLQLAGLLAGQAAAAIHNGQTYRIQQQHTAELSGLAQITQAFGSVRDPDEVFSRLVDSITPLVPVDIIGFLMYNETQRRLEARRPFRGLPDPVVELYQSTIEAGSLAEKLLLEQSILFTDNAADDERWADLGMDFLARAASLRETVLIPLTAAGHMLGFLQASNHTAGPAAFSQAETHLLVIAANQAAAIIENMVLVQQARQRAQRAEALRRITSLASSAATLDEILQFSLQELARLLRADAGAVFLVDPDAGQMKMHLPSRFGDLPDLPREQTALFSEDTQFHLTAAGSQKPLTLESVSKNLADPDGKAVIPFYQALLTGWGLESLIIVPLVVRSTGIGELWLGSRSRNFFDPGDTQVTVTAAGQLAGVVEQASLRSQTDENLRQRIAVLQHEHDELAQAAAAARADLTLALKREADQIAALESLNLRSRRMRASLDIAAQLTRQDSESSVLHNLAAELMARLDMQVALVAVSGPAGPRLVEILGACPPGAHPEALMGQRNPLRLLLNEKNRLLENALLLIADLERDAAWRDCPLLNALEARSLIGMRLEIGGGRTAGLLLTGQQVQPVFLDEDRSSLAQLAQQASVCLQNLAQLAETRGRLREVDLMLDFSRKLGSLQPAEIFKTLVASAAQVLPVAQAVWVGAWEDKEQAIIPQAAAGYSAVSDLLEIRYPLAAGEYSSERASLPLGVFRSGQSERIHEVDFAGQYLLAKDDLLRYRRATGGRLPVAAMLVPLRSGERVLGVLFLENFDTLSAFTAEDEALASSFARQAAMALDNARLYQASERRAAQLQALTMVASTITSSLQRDELISSLLDRLKLVLPYETATLWLRQDDLLTVAAATGFDDNERRQNLTAKVEDSLLFKTMIETGEPISVGDLRSDSRFPALFEPENLSWLGIPLIYKSEVIGLIALEKHEADFYSPDSIQAGMAFASQAAVSLENARLFEESTHRAEELDERSQRLALLNRLSSDLAASLDIDHITRLTGEHLCSALAATGAVMVAASALPVEPGSQGEYLLQSETPTHGSDLPLHLPPVPLLDHLSLSQGIFQSERIRTEAGLQPLVEAYLDARGAESLLIVPLIAGSVLQGWFLIYNDRPARCTLAELELARTICNQSAVALQNARLFAETHRLKEGLERLVDERTLELRREHKNSQTLLHIISELSSSLDIELVINRALAVINEAMGCEESLMLLSQAQAAQYRAGLRLARGALDTATQLLTVERQIARWVVRSRKPVLVSRVQEDRRWIIDPQATLTYQSVLAVPLVMGEEVLGALLLFHRQADFFAESQVSLLEASARQISISVNNAELYSLIRDQSEHLGNMLREQQIEASRSRAILEAVADGVLVTDANNQVTLFNASAERILDLTADQVMGASLDHFSGLFGMPASAWTRTIRSWSQNPETRQDARTYAEQVNLDNGRIVAVHLAPVFWRQEFLGTVSIFRDITHQVQVDRLKSEFVANVSHELRTPLTSIKGYVEIILMGAVGEITPQQAQFMKVVKSNTERLSGLVDDLLDISRIEAGRVSLNFQALDLREIAGEVLADHQRRSRDDNRPMTFRLDVQPGLPFAQGDAERIRQVINSLVSNGYLYTPEGGQVTIHIHMAAGAQGEHGESIQVDVQDTGIGITPEASSRIFERFYRGEDPLVLASAGTGLGLAIARTLVEMHNGRIWFASGGVRGEGSVFSFTLPVYER